MTAGRLLELDDVHTEIDLGNAVVRAVDGVSLHVSEGETLGVVGESGCGKSMTALSVIRLLPPGGRIAAGRIVFDGRDLLALGERDLRRVRGSEIGVVFQDPLSSLNPTSTVLQQVTEPLRLHTKLSRSEIRKRAIESLELVGVPRVEERLGAYPHQLSGGLRQRVAIAIALVCKPRLLIADEPTTALDVTIQRQILDLIDDLRGQLGMAVILVTHDLGVIANHTDRVVVMYGGRVVESATTHALFAAPRHRYTQALFSALPERAVSRDDDLLAIPGHPPDLTQLQPGCRFAARCSFVTEVCRADDPQLTSVSPSHAHACIHPASPTDQLARGVTAHSRADNNSFESKPDTTPALVVKDVVKTFPLPGGGIFARGPELVQAVAGVSLQIAPGTTFGLVGESGCGKSTLALMIAALEKPSSGSIALGDTELAGRSERELRHLRSEVQIMFQDAYAAMNPRLRALAIAEEPFLIQGVGPHDSYGGSLAQLFNDVGLPWMKSDRYPHELSGGERQRLALARALALKPSLIVADEPVSALDVSIQAQILNLMRRLQREQNLTYLLVSHDLAVVRYMANQIGVMYLGKLVECGPAADVYERPLHPYTRALIDAVPVANPHASRRAPLRGELPSAADPPSGCRFRTRCPIAQPVCAEQEPILRPARPGQNVACHFPLEAPPEVITSDKPANPDNLFFVASPDV